MNHRILLIGHGPLPGDGSHYTGFPQLRTASFLEGLRSTPMQVGLVELHTSGPPAREPPVARPLARERRDYRHWRLHMASPDWLPTLRALVADWKPGAIVTAGPYHPMRAAIAAAGDLPLWIDVPGDPFAEAQAMQSAARTGFSPEPGSSRQPHADQVAAYVAALQRGDSFSVISRAQGHAILGQLGMVGRLATSPVDWPWFRVVPPLYPISSLPLQQPRHRAPGSPLVLLLAGGFNTWLDVETIAEGLHMAMSSGADISVICTGGAFRATTSGPTGAFATWWPGDPTRTGSSSTAGWPMGSSPTWCQAPTPS